MRFLIGIIVIQLLFSSCSTKDSVTISGRVENGDSTATVWVDDSLYTFALDENGFFSGKISLKKSTYASFSPNSIDIYLSPGEDLDVYVNRSNVSGSLNFRGSLGGINNYLKEQEMAVFFDRDDYVLDEEPFIQKMKALIDEKIKLLEAKNFDKDFTELEKLRIRYSIGGRVIVYPVYKNKNSNGHYKPGKAFTDFMATFPPEHDELFGSRDYRKFLLDYVYFQNGYNYNLDYSDGIADFIVQNFTKPNIRNFLLIETVYRYIWENNGVLGAEHLLDVFYKNCTSGEKVVRARDVVGRWEKLLPGNMAPAFQLEDLNGNKVSLSDFKGSYIYIAAWATWCVPCKNELSCIGLLEKEYEGKNIRFLTVSVDGAGKKQQWKDFLSKNHYAGTHTIANERSNFGERYIIISVPRFFLIDPDGRIVSSNAPRPSGSIRALLNEQEL